LFLIELNKIKNEIHAKIPDKINKSLLKKYEYSVTKKDKNIDKPDILNKNCMNLFVL
jgi:hypothetical protein